MIRIDNPDIWPVLRARMDDGTLHHVICEGARYHVIWWNGLGEYWIEPECEINKQHKENDDE